MENVSVRIYLDIFRERPDVVLVGTISVVVRR